MLVAPISCCQSKQKISMEVFTLEEINEKYENVIRGYAEKTWESNAMKMVENVILKPSYELGYIRGYENCVDVFDIDTNVIPPNKIGGSPLGELNEAYQKRVLGSADKDWLDNLRTFPETVTSKQSFTLGFLHGFATCNDVYGNLPVDQLQH